MRITVSGYGGEITLGSVTEAQYVYWKLIENEDDVTNMLMGWAEECEQEHPEELHLRAFYDTDDIAHANGATFDEAYITVQNNNDEVIWEGSVTDLEQIDGCEKLIESENEYYFSETEHKYAILCWSSEKGGFNEIIVEDVNEFDPKRLRLTVEDIEGNRIITSVGYEGSKYEDTGSYGTDGKGFEFEWLVNE